MGSSTLNGTQFASITGDYSLQWIGSYALQSQNVKANTSTIRLYGTLYVPTNSTTIRSDNSYDKLMVDGVTLSPPTPSAYRYNHDYGYSVTTGYSQIGYTDKVITHNADGTFPTTTVVLWADSYQFRHNGSASTAEGTISGIATIDRNGARPTIEITGVGAGSFTLNASSNAICNKWEYNLNNGTWHTFSTTSGTSASTSVTGLSPNTSYTVGLRVTRAYNDVMTTTSATTKTLGGSVISYASDISIHEQAIIDFVPLDPTFCYEVDFNIMGRHVRERIPATGQTTTYTYVSQYTFLPTDVPASASSQTISVGLTTYINEAYAGAIGYDWTAFQLIVPNVSAYQPTATITKTAVSSNTWINSHGLYVGGYSRIHLAVTAQAYTGTYIESVTADKRFSSTGGTGYNFESGVLGVGTQAFRVVVTDARGLSREYVDSVTFLSYSPPAITEFTVWRGTYSNGTWTTDTSGAHIKATIGYAGSLVANGNVITLTPTCRINNTDVSPNYSSGGDFYWTTTSAELAYTVTAQLSDSVGSVVRVQKTLQGESVPFNLNTSLPSAAFGKVATLTRGLEIANDWRINALGKYNRFSYMPYSFDAYGVDGQSGYARIATIKIVGTTPNTPIEFMVQRKNDKTHAILSLLFATSESLTGFYCSSGLGGTYSSNPLQAFAYKSSTSTWDIYVLKTSSDDRITVALLTGEFAQARFNVTYAQNRIAANAIPAGSVMMQSLDGYYMGGDTLTVSNGIISGLITNGNTGVRLSLVTPKLLTNLSSVSVTTMTGTLRGVSGFLDSNSSNRDWTSVTTASAYIRSPNMVSIHLDKSTAFTNITNESPVVFYSNSNGLVLTFYQ